MTTNVVHFPAAYNFGPVDAERLVYGFREQPQTMRDFQSIGRILRTSDPTIRADVIDATLDSYMIQRLVRDYGCSKRDIANTFGASRLGKSTPCVVLSTSAAWSSL
jgi:hypothetical protein